MPKKERLVRSIVPRNRHLPADLSILYEDSDIIVVDKPAGLLTVATETNKTKTLQYILTDYVRKGCAKSRNRVFTVHRLDQWTSGVLIFAKSEEMKLALQAQWKDTEKKYIAIVHGRLSPKQGTISSYLTENKAFVVYSTPNPAKGKLAHTAYKVLKETGLFSLVEINLLTGRKNQIRVHFADKGCPIAGDRKYGKSKDDFKRLALHSKSISFKHPATGKQMTFETKLPAYFHNLMGL
ncbi:MAG: RluA family pseudouridine synthase [Phycisphaerae bacterium]|jgi:tRNA pseudouridine32 synthase/23S rRNA pseudouridine746 synthase/23S rRNA pseudouridine1911/1915/1917 synthase